MTTTIGRDGTFWFFGFFGLCALVFAIIKVPETRNRSLEEIEQEIGGDASGEAAMKAA
jgi:hypothetical protein